MDPGVEGLRVGQWWLMTNGKKKTFPGDGNILILNFGGVYIGVCPLVKTL